MPGYSTRIRCCIAADTANREENGFHLAPPMMMALVPDISPNSTTTRPIIDNPKRNTTVPCDRCCKRRQITTRWLRIETSIKTGHVREDITVAIRRLHSLINRGRAEILRGISQLPADSALVFCRRRRLRSLPSHVGPITEFVNADVFPDGELYNISCVLQSELLHDPILVEGDCTETDM